MAEERGIYVVGEIGEAQLRGKVGTQSKYYLFTILGILLFLLGIIVYIYSATIMIFFDLRAKYWNWGFISLGAAVTLFYLSSILRNQLGYTTFVNRYDKYIITSAFGKREVVNKTQIYALSVKQKSLAFGLLEDLPVVYMSLYDRTIELPIYRYMHKEELVEYFSHLSETLQDDYYEVFQKHEITYPSLFRRVWKQVTGKFGVVILGIYLFMALWGAFSMLLYPPNVININSFFLKNPEISFSFLPGYNSRTIIYHPPDSRFILGTDFFGRDIFARLIYGTTHSIAVGLIGATVYIILAIPFGLITAFKPGPIDEIITRIGDIFLTFPPAVLLLIVASFVNGFGFKFAEEYYYLLFFTASFFTWPQGSKLLRSETKRLLKQDYITASRKFGASDWIILKDHIIPKLSATMVLLFVFAFTEVIIAMTMIGLLQLGGASSLTWGSDIEKAITFDDIALKRRWWTLIFPTIWVTLFIVGMSLLSDSMRDQFELTVDQLQEGDSE